ncbi:ABC transporter substrate-binding protein [Sulfurospirillum sp. MES]|uniref:ABC transporter substrate-binding protein n=1 Tax=Sulfurospirillum sp. MES TaxID=1565314 RepID=UPI000A8E38FB|nr:ABC transporter substrate-binding protein [Sulfurospirillum sp. MES]
MVTAMSFYRFSIGFLMICFGLGELLLARSIVDMSGQTLEVPDTISKLYASSPPSTYMLYTIDPLLIVGLNFDHAKGNNESSSMLDPHFTSLPVIGGLQGGANSINRETLLALHPDAIISWNTDASSGLAAYLFQSSHIATINVNLESIDDLARAYRFLGELLDKKERTEPLALYAQEVTRQTRALVERRVSKRPVVYYAEGTDGLASECDSSSHYEAIKVAGGINPHLCQPSGGKGMEKVTLEQVILYNPDVIIAQEKEFVQNVQNDPRWRFVAAVQNKRVYLVPKKPFNWIDRPPSFMRLLGIQWLTHVLYDEPNASEFEMRMQEFYRLFLRIDLNQTQHQAILN